MASVHPVASGKRSVEIFPRTRMGIHIMLAQQVRLLCMLSIAYDIPFSFSVAVVMLNMGGPATVSQLHVLYSL